MSDTSRQFPLSEDPLEVLSAAVGALSRRVDDLAGTLLARSRRTSVLSVQSTGTVPVPTGSLTTIVTTPSLAVGTWVVVGGAAFTAAANASVEAALVVGTATATFAGKSGDEQTVSASTYRDVTVAAVVTVTVAGTVRLRAEAYTNAVTAQHTTANAALGPATGLVCVKVA